MLDKKNIVVAGAAGLLGAAVVSKLIELNASVIALDISSEKIVERLEGLSIDVEHSKVECLAFDITNEENVKGFFDRINGADGAVNCTYPRNSTYGKPFFDVSLASFNENVSLHLGSAFLFSQQSAAYFKKTNRPFSLVNIASIYGVSAPKFDIYENTVMTMPVEYAAIKSAIIHLNKYISAYVNNSNFRVNCVSPGGILDGQPAEFVESYRNKTNGTGMLGVQDVLGAIAFLLSNESKFITGQNIIVDDGFCDH